MSSSLNTSVCHTLLLTMRDSLRCARSQHVGNRAGPVRQHQAPAGRHAAGRFDLSRREPVRLLRSFISVLAFYATDSPLARLLCASLASHKWLYILTRASPRHVSHGCAYLFTFFNQQVDDLRSVDALEEEISATAVVMIFVSKGYFLSKSKRAHTRYSDITTYIVYGMLPEAV